MYDLTQSLKTHDGKPWRIAVMGDRESVQGFMAVGFSVFETADDYEADAAQLRKLASGGYAVIFVTEDIAIRMSDIIAKYKSRTLPAIISIPGREGTTGYGMQSLRESVERAVGFANLI